MKNKKTLLLLLFSTSFLLVGFSQNLCFDWANQVGGVETDYSSNLVTDSQGNLYLSGVFQDEVDLDPGENLLPVLGKGHGNAFIQKLDSSGTLVWARYMLGDDFIRINSMSISEDESIYMTGTFAGTVDFDPSQNVENLTATGFTDAFILKYHNDGSFAWVKQFGGESADWGQRIEMTPEGDVIIAGVFIKKVDFDPSPENFFLESYGSNDVFLLKLDQDGGFIWVKQFGGTGIDLLQDMLIDDFGDIYLLGSFTEMGDFDPGPDFYELSGGLFENYIVRLDADAGLIWAKNFEAEFNVGAKAFDLDDQGNVVIVGSYISGADFNPDPDDSFSLSGSGIWNAFVLKLNSEGDFEWAKNYSGDLNAGFVDIEIDVDNNILVTGYYTYRANCLIENHETPNTVHEEANIVLSKLNVEGDEIWSYQIEGTGYSYGRRVLLTEQDVLYLTGRFSERINLNLAGGLNSLGSAGKGDLFLAKYNLKSLGTCDRPEEIEISIGPNPTTGTVSLFLPGYSANNIYVHDVLGRQLYYCKSDFESILIDLSDYASGAYIVSIERDGQVFSKKVIKF